mmetsp:Transcript_41121/g.114894  ORF Transcript_41121/g.114894 Transcript_41121/m.114894 type:complete len:215 (-) Transcript_41121:113-757(-)
MSSMLSTLSSTSSSPSPPPVAASKASPRAARAMGSAAFSMHCTASGGMSATALRVSASWAVIFAPEAFFFLPSRMMDEATWRNWFSTSPGRACRSICPSSTSAILSPEPLSILCRPVSSKPSSGSLPAAIRAAALSGLVSGASSSKRPAACGSSPAGASISPPLTSSSVTRAACFCAPRPRSPERIFASISSILGMIALVSLGAPPDVFHAPLA